MINILFGISNKIYKKNKKIGGLIFKINKLIVNLLYPIIQLFNTRCGIDENSEVVISLTTFPERIKYVWMTIATLLNQKTKPYKIVLWLAEEQFPDKKIPPILRRLCKRGLIIRYCDDLKPHKKYFYSIKEWPNKYILTCDDDMFYPENLLKDLWENSKKYPNYIICNNSMKATYDSKGSLIRRDQWMHVYEEMIGLQVCPVGCGGVLYPPNALDKEVFNKNALKEIALCQDDVWLKGMGVLNDTRAYNAGKYAHDFINSIYTQKSGLWQKNIVCEGDNYTPNEVAWNKMIMRYPQIEEKMKKDYERSKRNE